jgi:hypothetical protein
MNAVLKTNRTCPPASFINLLCHVGLIVRTVDDMALAQESRIFGSLSQSKESTLQIFYVKIASECRLSFSDSYPIGLFICHTKILSVIRNKPYEVKIKTLDHGDKTYLTF